MVADMRLKLSLQYFPSTLPPGSSPRQALSDEQWVEEYRSESAY